jgi:hypothetical protein
MRDIDDLRMKLINLKPLAHNITYLTRELNLDEHFIPLLELENTINLMCDVLENHLNKLRKLDRGNKVERQFKAEIRPSIDHKIARATKK